MHKQRSPRNKAVETIRSRGKRSIEARTKHGVIRNVTPKARGGWRVRGNAWLVFLVGGGSSVFRADPRVCTPPVFPPPRDSTMKFRPAVITCAPHSFPPLLREFTQIGD